jgi:hypothetical protein
MEEKDTFIIKDQTTIEFMTRTKVLVITIPTVIFSLSLMLHNAFILQLVLLSKKNLMKIALV